MRSLTCKLCRETKPRSKYSGSDNLCSDCGGGRGEKCSRCKFWWAVGVHIDKDDHLCNFCKKSDGKTVAPDDHIVYFARCGEFVKIGVTIRRILDKRISQLQMGSPVKIEVVGIEHGSRRRESFLHKKYASLHERGEWFALCGELAEYVSGLEKP